MLLPSEIPLSIIFTASFSKLSLSSVKESGTGFTSVELSFMIKATTTAIKMIAAIR